MQRRRSHSLITRLVTGAAVALVGASTVLGAVPAQAAEGEITYTLHKASNPTADQLDAYARITAAMDKAVASYNAGSDITKNINVYYVPSVATADAHYNGTLRFGSNRTYMVQGTAMHEISHTVGVGQSAGWRSHCVSGTWTGSTATALIKTFDGSSAKVSCGGGHFWNYGLNYNGEFSATAYSRHVEIVEAMVADGL